MDILIKEALLPAATLIEPVAAEYSFRGGKKIRIMTVLEAVPVPEQHIVVLITRQLSTGTITVLAALVSTVLVQLCVFVLNAILTAILAAVASVVLIGI